MANENRVMKSGMRKTVSVETLAMYLEFNILWHMDILAKCHNDFDRSWKQGQVNLLQDMVDELDGVPSVSYNAVAWFLKKMEDESRV